MSARKKPGRPRKRMDASPVGIYGIVSEPMDADNCIELVYNQPQLLKCIVSIFKEYDSADIMIEFWPDRVVFAGVDHSTFVEICVTISAADMNRYYFAQASASSACAAAAAREDVFRITAKRDNLEIVVSTIEKSHYKVTLAIRADDPTHFFIAFSSCEYDSEDCFEIIVTPQCENIADYQGIVPNLASYPLEFTLDAHHLRKKIGELKKVARDLVIKKYGGSDLELSFGPSDRVSYAGTYRAAQKIKLRSEIADGEMFIATMAIGRIKPLMIVNMPGAITFFANRVDPLVVQAGLDQRTDGHYAILARLLIRTTSR